LEETIDEHPLKEKELKLRLLKWNPTINLPHKPFEVVPVVLSSSILGMKSLLVLMRWR
jgi:hypothetical protein